jgi:Domain of Unknown Function with PDB structure (DUF3857)/Transglutaminase-like superfamily
MILLRGCSLVLAAIILVSASPLQAAGRETFNVKPPAAWVQPAVLPEHSPGGASMLLDDHQTRVTDGNIERYTRHTQVIAVQKDLEDFGQVEIEFEPSYQALTIHFIQIRRGQSVIDALRPTEVRVLHREEELEQQIFNGTVQAVAILHDLRVGDIVDVAYTVTGQNPVMAGKYLGGVPLDFYRAVKYFRYRLLWPAKRTLSMRNLNTDIEPKVTRGAETEYLWERRDIAALPDEDNVPSWHLEGRVDLSEFATWHDVVEWALPLYKPGNLSRDLAARIEAIARSSGTPAGRVVAALRLVQDDVRYLGIEMGPYSHQPTVPSKVLERRFGDCKDKALLLTTILRELGIDAAPALVNSESGKEIDKRQPSPYAFDHVIVEVRLNDKTYWLDGTDSYQRGTLDQFYNPNFEKALVLREETTNLEDIPITDPASPTLAVTERYRVQNNTSPVSFSVVTTYTGKSADDFRYYFAGTTLEKLSEAYLNYYADDNPGIERSGMPEIKDDEAANVISVTEKYSIPNFWKDSKHYIRADRIAQQIEKPRVSRRTLPLGVKYPLSITQRIEVELPVPGDNWTDTRSLSDNAMEFQYKRTRAGKLMVLEYSLKTLRDHVPAKEVQQHLATLENIWDYTGYNLPMNSVKGQIDGRDILASLFILGFIAVAFFVVLYVAPHRRRRIRKERGFKLGSDPSAPIPAPDNAAMRKHLLSMNCRCGLRFEPEGEGMREETILFDGERIAVFRGHCRKCRAEQDVYFRVINMTAATD